jgi:hypothetical protein
MKKLFTVTALACACGVTVSSAFAGPLMLGPAIMPIPRIIVSHVKAAPVTSPHLNLLNSYRQLRAFWVSRAIVR